MSEIFCHVVSYACVIKFLCASRTRCVIASLARHVMSKIFCYSCVIDCVVLCCRPRLHHKIFSDVLDPCVRLIDVCDRVTSVAARPSCHIMSCCYTTSRRSCEKLLWSLVCGSELVVCDPMKLRINKSLLRIFMMPA